MTKTENLPTTPDEWAARCGATRLDRSGVLAAFAKANASALSDDDLVDRLMELERLFTYDRSTVSGFRWTGTDADTIERAAILTESAMRGL